jgi:hypothetical protein
VPFLGHISSRAYARKFVRQRMEKAVHDFAYRAFAHATTFGGGNAKTLQRFSLCILEKSTVGTEQGRVSVPSRISKDIKTTQQGA